MENKEIKRAYENVDELEFDLDSLNRLADECHQRSKAKGFWGMVTNVGEKLMLMVSELAEALEADRAGKYGDIESFEKALAEKPNDLEWYVECYRKYMKGTHEEEIADLQIRLFDYAGGMSIDLSKNVMYKMRFNLTRENLHGKKY